MLKYLTNSEYREAYNFLNRNSFLQGYKFEKGSFDKIRIYMEGFLKHKPLTFFQQCFKILQTNKKQPHLIIRVLMFIHFALQTYVRKRDQFLQLFTKQINVVLEHSQSYSLQKHEEGPNRVIQSEKKQKKNYVQNKNVIQPANSKVVKGPRFNFFSVYDSNFPTFETQLDQPPQTQRNEKSYQFASSKQVLCQKFIHPYGIYLLKKCAVSNIRDETSEGISVWTQINMFTLIFKISEGISIIPRYYKNEYIETVLNLIQILSVDVHQYYQNIIMEVQDRMAVIHKEKKQKQLSQRLNPNWRFMLKNTEMAHPAMFYSKNQLPQMKQLLKQIAQINDKLVYIYCGKYVAPQLKERAVKMPTLLKPQSHEYEQIFYLIKQSDRNTQRRSKSSRNYFSPQKSVRRIFR